ncbi:MAG: bifunctional biotin--[acetyl-CoA-carboxylase] ligase/biotin operon repressor BirA [Pseudomonadales bacterium]|nr:bifunctional biotin--[acetyl-CoA-carboxylase] ligase/biotin operon repressor BirA [Pseudomonadales bacterium]
MQQLVELLSDGQFHSGDELGAMLGVSRAAVWKQVQKLQEKGLDIFSVKGKGYKLNTPVELLDASLIRSSVLPSAQHLLQEVEVHGVVSSTNDVAMRKASDGVGSGFVCFAEQQTAGRGRRGRTWVSPFGSNIYMSMVWNFHGGAAALEGLSLATGIVVAETLVDLGCADVQLKWPNDLLVGKAKLGGVLLEMTGDPSGHCQVVLGLGVNTLLREGEGAAIDQAYTQLAKHGVDISRNQLAGRIVSSLLLMLEEFSSVGFSGFHGRWDGFDAYGGQPVFIQAGSTMTRGVARGVDRTGGLRLETAEGVEVFKGGELSLRGG